MKKTFPKKVLILGSGGLSIGQAGEFDYSGSQAIKALKEEGIESIVINPNIATIQTDEKLADKIFFLPVTPFFVEKVIEKEKPDSILLSFGGQTALNCGLELAKRGVLKKFNVKVLGTPITAIEKTEDRKLFVEELNKIEVKTPKSIAVYSLIEARKAVKKIGFPVMIRMGFALGGKGSGIARNLRELEKICREIFFEPNQALIEECLEGWKEIEYEVVRDSLDNCITVCNMENFDPLGIHTGESIVVAPSQTLTNSEYHKLREISIKVIKHFGIIGECNIQFALNPFSEDYRVIEVNARLSRSSALASKATGYPLAFVATKIVLGFALPEIKNSVTRVTGACFEPALDYIVVKIPRWDLKKFKKVSKRIGSAMKSVGEVMAIGKNFEEALQKALRMLHVGVEGLACNSVGKFSFQDLKNELLEPTDERVFAIAEALKQNYSIKQIHALTKIDKWFLFKIQNIVEFEKILSRKSLKTISREEFLKAKQLGFSDKQLAFLWNSNELIVRKKRKTFALNPFIKQIDTLAAEYPAKTNYLYLTYNAIESDIQRTFNAVMVLGSGAYKIGSSVEFDWCAVNTVFTLHELGFKTIMVNFNPETVSTDYDVCDKLFFDELSFETVLDLYEFEQPFGVIVSVGGQIPNNLALNLYLQGVNVLGTSPESIDKAENRFKFSKLLDKLEIDQPDWKELKSISQAKKFCKKIGYPVLVRPSYVLSGAAMNVAFNDSTLKKYLSAAAKVSNEFPVVITKFITNARELELDGVAKNGKLIIYAITEHVENAGVHSGDATIVLPGQKIYLETTNQIKEISKKIARDLKITGPFNIQFLAKDNNIKVIECNLRASRSFPFCSKVVGKNFIELSTKAIMNKSLPKEIDFFGKLNHVGVKAPMFSFNRLKGADPVLGVEMASTGEVACLGKNFHTALLKALLSTGIKLPEKNVYISIGGEENKYKFVHQVKKLVELGFNIFASEHTSNFLNFIGVKNKMLFKVHEKKEPNVLTYLKNKEIDFVIYIPNQYKPIEEDDSYQVRRTAVDYSIPLITNLQLAKAFIKTISKTSLESLEIKSWNEFMQENSSSQNISQNGKIIN